MGPSPALDMLGLGTQINCCMDSVKGALNQFSQSAQPTYFYSIQQNMQVYGLLQGHIDMVCWIWDIIVA